MKIRVYLLLAVLALHLPSANARPHQPIDSIDVLDEQIRICLEYLADGRLDQAGLMARQIARRFPDFALGQLIAAEMDSVRAQKDVAIADHQPISRNVSELLLEARKRLAAQTVTLGPSTLIEPTQEQSLPGDLIQAGAHVSHILVVDLQASTLAQFDVHFRKPVLVRQHYIGSGEGGFGKRLEGDLKTPLGVYAITEFRTNESLPDLYGAGALTLDYPNTLDQHLGRTGYGIWLHGVPSLQRSRTPYSSEGCVTMSNEHLSRLSRELDASATKVILTNQAEALDSNTRQKMQQQFHQLFTTYQQAQVKDYQERLTSIYNDQAMLSNDEIALENHRLIRVNDRNPDSAEPIDVFELFLFNLAFSSVQPEDISIFRYPDIRDQTSEINAMVVTEAVFGAHDEYRITVYWAQNRSGNWQILTENLNGHAI